MEQRVDPTIQQRAKHMKLASRLLSQKSTNAILEDLA